MGAIASRLRPRVARAPGGAASVPLRLDVALVLQVQDDLVAASSGVISVVSITRSASPAPRRGPRCGELFRMPAGPWRRALAVALLAHFQGVEQCTKVNPPALDHAAHVLAHGVVGGDGRRCDAPFLVISEATKPMRRMLMSRAPWRSPAPTRGAAHQVAVEQGDRRRPSPAASPEDVGDGGLPEPTAR